MYSSDGRMEKRRFFAVGILFAFLFSHAQFLALFFVPHAHAAVPRIINYQGRLEDSNGSLIGGSSGVNTNFRFSIWNTSTVDVGTKLWPSGNPATTTHKVVNGVFDARIGDTAQGFGTLDLDFNTSSIYYLQVEVYSTSSAAFETLAPRQPIVSVGFAINADLLDGFNAGTSSNNLLLLNASGGIDLPSGQIRPINSASCSGLTAFGGGSLCYDTGNNNLFVFNSASSTWVSLGGSSSTGGTLQQAYDLGNTINTTSSRDVLIDLRDSAVDPNFIVRIATSSTGLFVIRDNNNANRLAVSSATVVMSVPTTVSSTLTVTGAAGLQGFTFTNATGTSIALSSVSSTNVSSTNISATGYLLTANLTATGLASTSQLRSPSGTIAGLEFTNATGSGNLQAATLKSTGATNVSGTLTATGATSLQGVSFTNASGTNQSLTGYQLVNGLITGTASGTQALALTGFPEAKASSSLFQFGPSLIQGGSANGTFLGANPTAFNGNFIDLQVASATKFRVDSSGNILVNNINATGTLTIGGVTSLQGFTFTNATGTSVALTTVSSTNVSSTNISATGYGLFPTLNFTNASGTNVTASGYLQSGGTLAVTNTTTLATAGGNVGIGTSSPQSILHLQGDSPTLNVIGSTGNIALRLADSVAGATRKEFTIINDTTNNRVDIQAIQQGVGARSITLNAAGGNVGIGTTVPSSTLHVVGVSTLATTTAGFTTLDTTFSSTGTTETALIVRRSVTGSATGTTSTGGRIQYEAETSDTTVTSTAAIDAIMTNAVSSTLTSALLFMTRNAGGVLTEALRIATSSIQPAQEVDLIPATAAGTSDLGSAAIPWDNLYAVNSTFTGTLSADILNATTSLQTGGVTRISSAGVLTVNTSTITGTLQVVGLASSTELRSPSGTIATLAFTTASGTNLSVTGYGLFPTLTFTSASGTNLTASGYLLSTDLTATGLVSSTQLRSPSGTIAGLEFTNATGSGNLQAATLKSTGATNVSGTLTATGQTSLQGVSFTNASGTNLSLTGYQLVNGLITGTASGTQALALTGFPEAKASSSLLQFGPSFIQGGSANGTFLGANPTAFSGNFLDLQVNSSTQFRVTSGGAVALNSLTVTSTLNVTQTSTLGASLVLSYLSAGSTRCLNVLSDGTVTSTGSACGAGGGGGVGTSTSGSYGIGNVSFFIDSSTISATSGVSIVSSTGQLVSASVSSTGITFTNATGSGNLQAATLNITSQSTLASVSSTNLQASGYLTVVGNGRFDGRLAIGTTTFTAALSMQSSTDANSGIAGIFQVLTFDPSVASGFQFGNRSIINVTGTATTTAIGSFIRMIDNSTRGHTVKGLEVQAFSGTNVQGENIAIQAFGKTFGIKAVTTGEAGGTAEPAALYGDLQNGTQGNAIRAYSSTSTSATLVQFFQESSAFTGTGLLMNFGKGIGSFTGNFMNLQRADITKFNINSSGTTVIASSSAAAGASSTLTVCALTNCTLPTATSSVAYFASVDGTGNTGSIVARGSIQGGLSDVAEYVAVKGNSADYEPGDLLSISTTSSVKFQKSQKPYDAQLAGIVTDSAAFIAGGEVQTDQSRVIMSLAGRVPVKVNLKNGKVKIGDLLTSSDVPGEAMKAILPGRVIGLALEAFDGTVGSSTVSSTKITVFINPHWSMPEVSAEDLQGSENGTGKVLNTYTFNPNLVYSFENLKVQNLEIGSEERPTGFTIYDVQTKQPYCVLVENGVLKSIPGKCSSDSGATSSVSNVNSTPETTSSPSPPPSPSPEQTQTSASTEPTTTASTTTESVATSTEPAPVTEEPVPIESSTTTTETVTTEPAPAEPAPAPEPTPTPVPAEPTETPPSAPPPDTTSAPTDGSTTTN